jgi:hypothetical protein
MEKAARLDHDYAGSATVRMAVGEPEGLRRFALFCRAAGIGREACSCNPSPDPCRSSSNRSRDRMGRTRTKHTPRSKPTPTSAGRS